MPHRQYELTPYPATNNVAEQIPAQKKRRKHSGTIRTRGFGFEFHHRRNLRRAKARGPTPPLRFSTRDGKRPALVGGSKRAVDESGRQASRGRGRGPSAGIRRLRGRDSAGK